MTIYLLLILGRSYIYSQEIYRGSPDDISATYSREILYLFSGDISSEDLLLRNPIPEIWDLRSTVGRSVLRGLILGIQDLFSGGLILGIQELYISTRDTPIFSSKDALASS